MEDVIVYTYIILAQQYEVLCIFLKLIMYRPANFWIIQEGVLSGNLIELASLFRYDLCVPCLHDSPL